MLPEQPIIDEILKFFADKFETKTNAKGFKFALYKDDWLNQIELTETSADEAKTSRTVKKLQEKILEEFGKKRIKIEANVAENMQLRFLDSNLENVLDTSKLMAFDILLYALKNHELYS